MDKETSSTSTDVKESEKETETTEATTNQEQTDTEQTIDTVVETEKETRENERIRSLVEDKNALQKMVDILTERVPVKTNTTQNVVVEEEDPDLDPVVSKAIKKESARKDREYGGVVSAMGEKLDDLESRDTVPNYKQNKQLIETYKTDYTNRTGRWITRYQAYAYLLADGKIKAPKEKEVVVNREKTKVVTETKTSSGGRSASAKEFSKMSLAEKEAYLENKPF